jgi:nucleotide-binding universal stress UspA family protein
MDSKKRTILVPTDFTPVAGYAIAHAIKFSKILNKEITLLHILKKDDDPNEAEQKIKAQAEETLKTYKVQPHIMVREGSIFSTIGEVSNELNAELVIMGTHGMHGMQKIKGSWALKVTVTSKAPVIIVQEPPKGDTIDRLVFPVDFKKENKEKIGWGCFIAKVFGSKILVLKPTFKDKGFIRGILSNMNFTEKYFKNKEVDYEIFTAEPKKNFADQTIEFAQKVQADLILIMTTKAINYADYIIGASEQHIIANDAKIPVMCVNPRPTILGSFSSTGC